MLGLVMLVGVFAVVLTLVGHQKAKGQRAFEACAAELALTDEHADATSLTGDRDGFHIHAVHTAGSRNSPSGFRVEVFCPNAGFELHVRLQSAKEIEGVKRGEVVDVDLRNPELDDLFIFEGAPTALVRRFALRPELREPLLALGVIEEGELQIENGLLILRRSGSEYIDGVVRTKLIRMALLFAKAVADESQLPPPEDEEVHAETYRTMRRGDDGKAALELAAVKETRAKRAVKKASVTLYLLHGFAICGAVLQAGSATYVLSVIAPAVLFGGMATLLGTVPYLRARSRARGLKLSPMPLVVIAATWLFYGAALVLAILRQE